MADDTLKLRVTADTSSAEGDLRDLDRLADDIDLDVGGDASRSMSRLVDEAGGLPGPLGVAAGFLAGPAGVAVGAGAAATAMFKLASDSADAAINAKALSTAVGGTVEESSRLLAVTEQVGLDYNDVLELIAESNKAMSANADEAERLGVNIKGTPIERFTDLVDAVYKIPDPLQRAATASKFFGEEGSKQLPKLKAQFEDVGDAMQEVSEARTFDEEDARNAVEFKQAMAELKAQFSQVANELGKSLIPALTNALEVVNRIVETTAKVSGPMHEMGDGFEAVGEAISVWNGASDEAIDKALGWRDAAEGAVGPTTELADAAVGLGETMGTGVVDAMGAVMDGAAEVVGALDKQREATDKAREANEELRDALFGSADASLEATRKGLDLNDALAEYRQISDPTRQDVESLNDAVFDFADAQVAAAGTTRDTTEGAKVYKDSLNHAAAMLRDEMNPELQAYIDKANAVPDTAITDVRADLDPTEFNEAERRADELDRRTVAVKLTADISDFNDAVRRLINGMLGTRAVNQSTGRYVYRNGVRTMVP